MINLCTTQELKALSSYYAYPLCSKPFSFCCWSLSAAASFFLFVSLFLFLFAFAPSFVLLCSLCCCLFCSCCFVFALAVSLCSFLFSCAIAHLPFLSSFPIFLSYLPSSSSSFVVLLPLYHAATFPLCCYVPFVMLLCLLQVASSDLPFLHCKSTREKILLFLHTAAQNASKFGSMSPH